MQKIGVLGGMMDPIHSGHLHAAQAALKAGLDTVLLAPCLTPAHRPQPLASADDRLEMCRIAAREIPGLEASDIELRAETCYAVDTVRMLQESLLLEKKKQHRKNARTVSQQQLIDRAKKLLMEKNGMTEEEAHRYLQKTSMDNGTGLVETAGVLLSLMEENA